MQVEWGALGSIFVFLPSSYGRYLIQTKGVLPLLSGRLYGLLMLTYVKGEGGGGVRHDDAQT